MWRGEQRRPRANADRRTLSLGPMCRRHAGPIILPMTRSATSSKAPLPADRPAGSTQPAPIPLRRYRVSRLRLDSRLQGAGSRFEYLKNVYD